MAVGCPWALPRPLTNFYNQTCANFASNKKSASDRNVEKMGGNQMNKQLEAIIE
jgi:hypothetical protein